MQNRDPSNFRLERIEKLLHELQYEVQRGMMERDLDETISFQFLVPISRSIPGGMVMCEFATRPVLPHDIIGWRPRLRLVKDDRP